MRTLLARAFVVALALAVPSVALAEGNDPKPPAGHEAKSPKKPKKSKPKAAKPKPDRKPKAPKKPKKGSPPAN